MGIYSTYYRWVEVRHAKHAEELLVGLFAQGSAFIVNALLDGFLVEVALVLAKRVSHSVGCLAQPQHTQTYLLEHSSQFGRPPQRRGRRNVKLTVERVKEYHEVGRDREGRIDRQECV